MIVSDREMKAGVLAKIGGELLTLRDQSASRLAKLIEAGSELPFPLDGAAVFFAAPTPGFDEGRASIGPTTSARMAAFVPLLLEKGVKYFIGKGAFPQHTVQTIIDNKAFYCQALGGIGAYYGSRINSMKLMLFPELGPEAIYKVEIEEFPLIISVDSNGGIFF